MTRLVLIKGAPGSGKSTVAQGLAQDRTMTLALNIDDLKHSLGRWDEDPSVGFRIARPTIGLGIGRRSTERRIRRRHGPVPRPNPFLRGPGAAGRATWRPFYEFVLDLDAATLAGRLSERASNPDRLEHAVNNQLVGPSDATALIQTIESLRQSRPRALRVNAAGPLSSTLDILRATLQAPTL